MTTSHITGSFHENATFVTLGDYLIVLFSAETRSRLVVHRNMITALYVQPTTIGPTDYEFIVLASGDSRICTLRCAIDSPAPDQIMSWYMQTPMPPVEILALGTPQAFFPAYKAYKAYKETANTTARVAPAPDEGLNVEKSQEEGLQVPA